MRNAKAQIGRFAGVIKTYEAVGLIAAGSENQDGRLPAAPERFREKCLDVMRANSTLQSVEQEQKRSSLLHIEVMQLDEIAVGRLQPLDRCLMRWLFSHEPSP